MTEDKGLKSGQAFEDYKRIVFLLLLDFQFIEELLKIVIGCSYELIRRSIPSCICFKIDRSSLEKHSLGKLIQRYTEISLNSDLIARLNRIASDRNFCAHRSFVLNLEEQEAAFLEDEMRRLEAIRVQSRACVMELQREFVQFSSLLQEAPIITVERDAPKSGSSSL